MTSLSKTLFKRGRPRKEDSQFKRLADERDEIIDLKREIDSLHSLIANLKHQEIGYQAVIDYLQHRLSKYERSTV
jgi:hypothetical protein